ncbi:MAG: HDOD domain-containing protein [Nitrospira sp.]|nr:HDOD domain-containing protein [Nitrospira sp.]MDH4343045.1 HDOD domain-containing protein [Nitrospira sp.]MDH5334787.1 HDOD domain-containing protein [Nitrospira sp.]
MPQAASKVMALASDPNADAAKLSAMIHQDQALAAHVLRIANSPAYMPRSPVVSLQHAVAMLGITLLSEIAFTASLKVGAFQVPGYEDEVKQLWRHSLATGAFAKEVARVKRMNVESAYLCGLLHEIGKPVVLRITTTIAREQSSKWVKALATILNNKSHVKTLIEGYHTRVGVLIAEKWSLPKQVAEAIQYYEDYEHTTAFRQECMLTFVADRLASHLLTPEEMPEDSFRDHSVFAELNLYPQDVDKLLLTKDQVLTIVNAMNL